MIGVTTDRVWIGNRFTDLLQLVTTIKSIGLLLCANSAIHYSMHLVFSVSCVSTSCPVTSSTVDVPLPLGPRTVPMPQP
jgi:hypothetical protein